MRLDSKLTLSSETGEQVRPERKCMRPRASELKANEGIESEAESKLG